MLTAILNAFRVPELRKKIFFTLGIIVLYRIGSYIPLPGIPFEGLVSQFEAANTGMANTMALLNLFSGGALSYVSLYYAVYHRLHHHADDAGGDSFPSYSC